LGTSSQLNHPKEHTIMKKYIDGFVIPIAPENIPQYEKTATLCSRIWKAHGALEYIEAVGDDLAAMGPDCRSAAEVFGAQPGETLIFAYIVYESREHRDAVNAKVMADPRMKEICPGQNPDMKLAFDPRRMMYGGFREIVGA
jgi:uncharacterized protein YbaA (DUF1428 family)